jgi:acyl-CoA dehydrogenase
LTRSRPNAAPDVDLTAAPAVIDIVARARAAIEGLAPLEPEARGPDDHGAWAVWRELGPVIQEPGFAVLAALHAELGRALLLTPHLSSSAIASVLLERMPQSKLARAALERNGVVSVALAEPGPERFLDGWDAAVGPTGLTASKRFVADLDRADAVLVGIAGERPDQRAFVTVAADRVRESARRTATLAQEPAYAFDVRGIAQVDEPLQTISRHELLEALAPGAAMVASAATGAALRCVELTVEFARERVAFGRPIASFQAIQHNLATLRTRIAAAAGMTDLAVWALDAGEPTALRLAGSAFIFATAAFTDTAALCLRYHGGRGYLVSTMMPIFYRKAKSWEMSLGGPRLWEDAIAAEMLDGRTAGSVLPQALDVL